MNIKNKMLKNSVRLLVVWWWWRPKFKIPIRGVYHRIFRYSSRPYYHHGISRFLHSSFFLGLSANTNMKVLCTSNKSISAERVFFSETICINQYGDGPCQDWADKGECQANPSFMLTECRKACGRCLNNDGDDDAPDNVTKTIVSTAGTEDVSCFTLPSDLRPLTGRTVLIPSGNACGLIWKNRRAFNESIIFIWKQRSSPFLCLWNILAFCLFGELFCCCLLGCFYFTMIVRDVLLRAACKDNESACKSWAKYCSSNTYVIKNCPKTCNRCDKVRTDRTIVGMR